MNLAKISANGQITVPVEIRRLLVFPQSKPAKALLHVADNHEMILCDRNTMERRCRMYPHN